LTPADVDRFHPQNPGSIIDPDPVGSGEKAIDNQNVQIAIAIDIPRTPHRCSGCRPGGIRCDVSSTNHPVPSFTNSLLI